MTLLVATVASVALITSAWAQGNQPPSDRGSTSMAAPEEVRRVAPALDKYTHDRLLGDVWKRPGLGPRDRSVVTIAALIARNQTTELPYYLDLALDHGVKPREISEIITHLAFYSGWGHALSAVGVAKGVFARRQIGIDQLPQASPSLLPLNETAEAERAARVSQQLGAVAPRPPNRSPPCAACWRVSASGYYAWRKRPLSARARADVELGAEIQAIHRESRGTYGAPRIHAELAARGVRVGRKWVARLMRRAGLQGVSRRKQFQTTRPGRDGARPAPDLVDRQFVAAGPDRLWVADITYVPTWAGFLYLAVVLDAWSRRVVGWAMETHLRTELVLAALDMAVTQRRPVDVIHHSDQGCQYTSVAFGTRCHEAGVRPSMGSVGDAYDNALCESFFATLECELLDRHRFQTQAEARLAIFDFIEGWYNPRRRHSALDYLSPIAYEKRELSLV